MNLLKILWHKIPLKKREHIRLNHTRRMTNIKRILPKDKRYTFIDRKRNRKNLVYVLSGYKPELWEEVFRRIEAAIEEAGKENTEFDVCILSAGKYVQELDEIAHTYGYSYLFTRANNVPLVQNLAIRLHKNAEYIWKFDEDMFIPSNYFTDMLRTFRMAGAGVRHLNVGMAVPTIPVNSYGYIKFLSETGKLDDYEKQFGRANAGTAEVNGAQSLYTFEAQKFIWDCTGDFDSASLTYSKKAIGYEISPGRYSIGAILFTRSFFNSMKYHEFDDTVSNKMTAGEDEDEMMATLINQGWVCVICNNVLTAHLSFGAVTDKMIDYLKGTRYVKI